MNVKTTCGNCGKLLTNENVTVGFCDKCSHCDMCSSCVKESKTCFVCEDKGIPFHLPKRK